MNRCTIILVGGFFMKRFTHLLILVLSLLSTNLMAGEPEEVLFERPDGAVLRGTFHPGGGADRRPTVLLLHQAQSSRTEFDFLLGDLHALGFNTLAVDLRGHGESSKPEKLGRAFFMKLFRDPGYAPPDIQAILQWLASHDRVDPESIAVMGGSVGANLAYVANGAGWHVETAVVLSGNAEAAAELAADVKNFAPKNVLLLAAANDHGRDAYAKTMYEQAGEPKRIEILEGSSAHGVSLLRESAELKELVLQWLAEHLNPGRQ